jgi:ubiquinone/menaquinone biosynthesis C-methylase UbiE
MKTVQEARNFYNQLHEYEIFAKLEGWQIPKLLVEYLKPFLIGNEQALDVGCGPGEVGEELEKIGWKGVLTGVDIAENRLKEAALKPAYNFCVQADAYHLPFRKQSFDIVASSAMVALTGIRSIKEMYRLVKPGGYFACIAGEIKGKNFGWCRRRFKEAARYFDQLSLTPGIQRVFYKDLGSGYTSNYDDEHYTYYIFRKSSLKLN